MLVPRLFDPPTVDVTKLNGSYRCHAFQSGKGFVRASGIDRLHFDSGKLSVDDLPILKPRFGHDRVSWHQQTAGRYSGGHLHFSRGGTEASGVIFSGTTAQDAVRHDVLATTLEPVAYDTQITTQRYPANTDPTTLPASAWTTGLQLAIGYSPKAGSSGPSPVAFLDSQCISSDVTWGIDPTNQATVFAFGGMDPTVFCLVDSSLYLQASVEFPVYQPVPTFSGTVTSTCADQSGNGVYFWKGTAGASVNLSCSDDMITLQTEDFTAPRTMTKAAPLALTEDDLIDTSSDPLSLTELMTLVPDDTQILPISQTLLVENMKWAMGQSSTESGWLGLVFGEVAPVLSPNQQTLANQSLNWYQNNFAKAYVGWAISNYSGAGAPTSQLTSDQQLQLEYYLETGMAQDPDYNTQQNGIYMEAYVQSQPRLGDYIADTASDWGTQLYNAITTPAQILLAQNRIAFTNGATGAMTPINNLATMLLALAPNSDQASTYYQYFQNTSLVATADQTVPSSQTTMANWLPLWITKFLTAAADSGSVPDSAQVAVAAAAADLKAFITTNNNNTTDAAAALATYVFDANGASLLAKSNNAATAFLADYPKLTSLGNMFFFMTWSVGVLSLYEAFTNWGTLTDDQKAQAVTASVTLGMQTLASAPDFISGVKAMGISGYNSLRECWASSPGDDFAQRVLDFSNDPLLGGARSAADALSDETSALSILCGGLKSLLMPIGVVASAVFAVLSAIQFADDLKDGAGTTQTAFDGVMMGTQIASTVALAAGLALGSVVCATAAAVFGLVGVVIAIVAYFVIKPVSPLETLMSKTIIPFVAGLAPQTPPPSVGSSSTGTTAFAMAV